ncbi:MAG: nucleotide exchange factor GrpE [bacterium]
MTKKEKDQDATHHTQEANHKEAEKKVCADHDEKSQILNAEEESYKEQFLRINADFQNFKRRVEKERIEWMAFAQAKVLEVLVPIFDELERAIALVEQKGGEEAKVWLDGFKLIQKNWEKTFKELGIEEIAGTGKFDPELHDAMVQVESKDVASGNIVQCFEKGYKFKDKIIKHAKVSVAK